MPRYLIKRSGGATAQIDCLDLETALSLAGELYKDADSVTELGGDIEDKPEHETKEVKGHG